MGDRGREFPTPLPLSRRGRRGENVTGESDVLLLTCEAVGCPLGGELEGEGRYAD